MKAELLAAQTALEEAKRRLRTADRMLGNNAPPLKNQVSFVGGPLDGTKRIIDPSQVSSRHFGLPVFARRTNALGETDEMPDVLTGSYRIFDFATKDSHESYHVGVWEGVR